MTTFVEARQKIEGKDRSARDKRTTAADAAQLVQNGDHLAIGGCLYSRTPMATLREILRRRPSGLTISRNLTCYEGELFMVAGAVDTLITAWMGIGLPWGLSPIQREWVEQGRINFQEMSHLSLGLGYRAGAMGIPFLPTLSMLGSDLMETSGARAIEDPFTGETVAAIPAIFPDVAIIHVHRADMAGNGQIRGYPHMDADLAMAATTVILSAEEIVDTEEIRKTPDSTVIPFFTVDAVVEAPFGSYPHECYGLYDADIKHIDQYARRVKAEGAEGVRAYLEEYIYGPDTFDEFLDLIGRDQLEYRRRKAVELVG